MGSPVGAGFEIFFESNVSEEKFGVSIHGGHDLGSGDNLTDLLNGVIERSFVWIFKAPYIPKSLTDLNAPIGEGVEVRSMPLVWEVAWVSRTELAPEWPYWVGFVSSMLIVIGKTFKRHVSNVLRHLGKLGMGCHQITPVFR